MQIFKWIAFSVIQFFRESFDADSIVSPIFQLICFCVIVMSFASGTAFTLLCAPCQSANSASPPWCAAARSDCKADEGRQLHARYALENKSHKPKILFIGDSILAYWPNVGATSWNKNFVPLNCLDIAIGGEITQSILWRLDHGAVDGITPDVIVLMVGSNNLVVNTPEDTTRGIEAVIEKLQQKLPRCKILLLSILPRDPGKIKIPLRPKIEQTNSLLKKLPLSRVTFIDAGDSMLDKDGSISHECMPDGIHPSAQGYERLTPFVLDGLRKI